MKRALLTLFVIALAGPVCAQECPIGRAVYGPVGAAGELVPTAYELTHGDRQELRRQSNLSVTIRNTEISRAYDFTYAFSNGYGRTHLVYAGRSGETRRQKSEQGTPGSPILFFDEQIKTVQPVYAMKDKAPAYLLMPEMGVTFWYGGDSDRKFVPPDGLWTIVSCK